MSMMNTSVSGMLADSNWLSNISQNVANANTTGYKNAETEFSAIVDQAGSSTVAGSGVTASLRSLNSVQGNVVGTTTTTDLAVQGDGYFIVSDSSGNIFLTRNGSFVPDNQGNLVNSAGYYLMGQNVQGGANPTPSNSTNDLTKVNVTTAGEAPTPSSTGTLAVNLPSTAAAGATETTSLVTYDNLGGTETIDFTYTNVSTAAAPDTWTVTATDAATGAALGGATMSFNPANGQLSPLTAATGPATINDTGLSLTVPNGQPITVDLGATTQLASGFAVNTSTANGNPSGSLSGVSISSNGTLSFLYSNGQTSPAYDIELATVPSEDNLTSVNGDAFSANEASGAMRIASAGTNGLGTIASSSLENSTVDLATELTQMIEAQSSYQANSKAFQTGADILDVLNNLKT
jgi:flagellar hook protein FlgE